MTNYYNSVSNSRDTILIKTKFGSSGSSPNSTNTSRRWLASLFLLMSIFIGQVSFGQVNLYSFAQSTSTYTPVTTPTNVGTATWDDTVVAAVPIGFTFSYNSVNYTTCTVSPNGAIYFGATTTNSYTPISATTTYAGVVAAFARDLINNSATITRETIGTAPNRTFVVQWNNARRYSLGAIIGDVLNFQIRLNETTNTAQVVYGNCTATSTTALTSQVGLRGATNTVFNNRSSASSWSATSAGTTNAASVTSSNSIMPSNGLTFTWAPPVPCAGTPAPGNTIASTTALCLGVPTVVTFSLQNVTSGTGVTYQWFNNTGSIAGATSSTYTTPALTASDSYFCNVTCSAVTTASAPVAVNVSTALSTFPITEGFESITTAGSLANCFVSTPASSTTSKVRTFVGAATGTNSALSARTGNNYAAVNFSPSNTTGTIYSAAVQLTAGNTYSAEVFYKTDGVAWSTVALKYGTVATEAGMTNTIASVTNAAAISYTSVNGTFVPATSGVYYIAFQAFNATSAPNYCVFDDFSLNELLPCAGAPNLGTVAIASASGCAGLNVNLTSTGITSGLGITYQWQSSTDNINFTDISGATAANYSLATLSGTNYYRLNTTCANSATTVSSNSVSYTGTVCTYNTSYSTGAAYSSIMPANGGTGVAFPGWVNTTSGDDNTSTLVSLAGTTFNYQGAPVTGFQACSNGWVTFNTPTTEVQYTNNLSVAATSKLLAPLWDDLVFTGQSYANRDASMRYSVSGTLGSGSAVITVEWAGMERFNLAGPNLNFQVKLYESDNHIEYIYGVMDAFDGTLGSAVNYSYSIGYNGTNPAGTSSVDRFALQQVSQNYFSTDAITGILNSLPVCNSMYTFTPGVYSGLTVAPAAVIPSNDNSANALNLTVTASPISTYCGTYYSSKNATNSASGLACGALAGNEDDDVWFKFTTTAAVDYNIKLRSSTSYNGVLQLLDAAFAPITCVNASGVGLTETINANALTAGGTTYYLRVFHDGVGSSIGSGEFSVSVNEVILPPTNDNIAGATPLTVGLTCSPLNSQLPSTLASTASTTLPIACNNADDDVWYSFVASSTTNEIKVQSGTGYNAAFQVLSSSDNTATGTLTQVDCINLTTTGGAETSSTTLVPGNTYFVRVYHAAAGAATGNFSICVTAPIPTCATVVAPLDLAIDVATNQALTWTATPSAASYDVFFGPTATGAVFVTNQTTTTYSPTMLASTSYTWKVVPKNGNGAAVGCTELTFTTAIPPGCTQLDSPANAATGIPVGIIPFTWTAPAVTATATAATSYDLFYRTSLTGPKLLIGNFTDTNASITLTGFNATFYMTVVPKNALGAATGCTETSFTTEADPFTPYCSSITYLTNVEPITSVNFAGINNTSSDVTGGSSIENFISVIGSVATGVPYTMTLKGNTDGPFTNNFRVFADWNKDGDFADAGETYNAGTIFSSTGTDAVSAVSTILVPATASLGNTRLRIKKQFSATGVDDPCAGNGYGQTEDYTINVVQSITTSLTTAACGSTLPLINSVIYATPKGGAVTGYRFEVTIPSQPLVAAQTVDRPLQFFNLTQLASYEYATTYSVRVMLRVGTEWLGYYGPACTVTTPGVLLSPTVGPATVSSPACGITLATRGTTIYTTPQLAVTGYRFRIKTAGQPDVILDRTLQFFSFNDVSTFVYGSTYTVEVTYKTTGDYLPFGTPCTFITPETTVAATTCGATIAAGGTIYAKAVSSAVSYKFEVTNLADEVPTPVVYSRPAQFMPTSLLVGYASTISYSVRVAVETTAGVSPFGTACVINPAVEARQGINQSIAFSAVAFPNPFETNFTINVTTSSDEKVTVAVYDMIGKTLENKEVSASNLNAIEVGNNLKSGVYNVIVTQGLDVKTIRMIKR